MKRVLCIVSGMNTGGAETFLMKLYRNIDRNKYQMDFGVYTDKECFYDAEIISLGGNIYHLTPKTKDFKRYKQDLYTLVKEKKFQYVLRITSNAAGFLDLKIAHDAGAKVCIARSSNSSDGDSLKVSLIHQVSRMLYGRYVDVKIAPSDLAATYTFGKKAVDRGDVKHLHNALDLDVYSYSKEKRQAIRKEYNIDDGCRVFGHIGRFSEQKNHKFLINVFVDILNKESNAVLLLVGAGELESEVRNMVSEYGIEQKVIFAGVRSDIPDVLSAMDVFIFPSLYEGMPNTIIEAQATGLQCVAADTITKQANITGLVEYLPLNDIAEWANCALNKVSQQRCNTREIFVRENYEIKKVAKMFEQIVFEFE